MTDLEIYQPRAELAVAGQADTDSWITVCSDVIKVANVIYDTPFVPEGLRGSAPAVAAAILAGRELGIGPMTALQHIHVIKGKPAQSAALMRALIQSAGHKWEDGDVSDTRAVVRGCRKGESSWSEVTFTADQAERAGIDLGKYPADKLYARATSRLARRKFADVIAGMPYSAEDLEDGGGAEEGTVAEAAPAANGTAPKAPARTARRARTASTPPAASSPAPPVSGPQNGSEPAQPPLPGEDEPAPPKRGNGITGVIQAHFRRLGFTDDEREQRLILTGQIAGREVTSTNELSPDEHKAVADTLARCRDREALIALLVAAGQDADAEGAGDER